MGGKKKKKPIETEPKTLEEKYQILSHLRFEWWMFLSLLHILKSNTYPPDHPIRIAALESFMIHGRLLLQFFHGDRKHSTDWHVRDLIDGPYSELEPELVIWCNTVNKHVAHLTDGRKNQISEIRTDQVFNTILIKVEDLKIKMGDEFPRDWSVD